MRYNDLLPAALLAILGGSCATSQPSTPHSEEHRLEKSGEPCVTTDYDGEEEERCTTLNLSWLSFEDLPALNDSIDVRVRRMIADSDDQDEKRSIDQLAEEWYSRLREEATQDTLVPAFAWVWDFDQDISVHEIRGDLLTLYEESYIYAGGAHGLPYAGYLHWNVGNDREMILNDLLINGQQEAFWALAQEAHERWLDENDLDQDFREYWQFERTDEFYFGEEGLFLLYNVYHIAPYAMGPQELVISWGALEGVIEPDVLALVD